MTTISSQTFFLLALSKLKGVGPAALKKVASIPQFDKRPVEELATLIPQIARSLEGGANWAAAQDWAHAQVLLAERHSARILSPLDAEYPALLAQTKDDPFILYVQGSLAAPGQRSVAVIGTREPTTRGAVVAQRITTQFGLAGWSIVSGLALGCDSLAHRAALDCGAHTVAVLAHGLHMIAPSKNVKLSQEILAAGGALVTEYPFGQAVQSQQYVKRDRTQAGLALGVVMIQSDIKGGSLYASRATLEYGRWLAVPYPTERDLENREPKVQANIVIADAPAHERADLLRCAISALSRVIVLRNKEDNALLSESDGVRPFERMAVRNSLLVAGDLSTSTDAFDALSAQHAPSDSLLECSVEAPLVEPVKHGQATEASAADADEGPSGPAEAAAGAAGHQQATTFETTQVDEKQRTPMLEMPVLEAVDTFRETSEAFAPSVGVLASGSSEPDASATSLRDSTRRVFAAKFDPDAGLSKVTGEPRLFLSLALPKGGDLAPAFGLWSPPKVGTGEFKKLLGNVRDDRGVREFYARHKRVQSHLATLQRKLVQAKWPMSHDKRIDLRLDAEEAVLYLINLVRASVNIEAIAAALRQRDAEEDWIKRFSAEQRRANAGASGMSEYRHCLVEDLLGLIKLDLGSFVIADGDIEGADLMLGGDGRQLSMHQVVERLNSVLKATFREELEANSEILHGSA